MLQHEPQEQSAATPTAQIRVTAEELAQAINALEASKDEEAQHLAGTVAIGQVVDELKLDATPEEVWAQVQKQRAQAADREAERARQASVSAAPVPQETHTGRRLARGGGGAKVWLWILFWCCGGMGLVSSVVHRATVAIEGAPATVSQANLTLSENGQQGKYVLNGRDVLVSGSRDTITLRGDCPTMTITGNSNRIRVEGKVERVIADGNVNIVTYTAGPPPAFSGGGNGNHVVEPSVP